LWSVSNLNLDTDFENETKAFMDVVMSNLPASQNRIELIKTESAKDEIFRNLISYCKDGWHISGNFSPQLPTANLNQVTKLTISHALDI
jgi:hypothetical protein